MNKKNILLKSLEQRLKYLSKRFVQTMCANTEVTEGNIFDHQDI